MVRRLLYRIEHPGSVSRFVEGHGILSKKAISMLEKTPPGFYTSITATIPWAQHLHNTDEFMLHLRGHDYADFFSPFISFTSDFYRALSLAAKYLTDGNVTPEHIKILVVDLERLDVRDVVECLPYMLSVPANVKARIDNFDYRLRSVNANSEYIVCRYVPVGAILSQNRLSDIFGLLPRWTKEPGGHELVRYTFAEDGQNVRIWKAKVIAARYKHKRIRLSSPDTYTLASNSFDLASRLLGPTRPDLEDLEEMDEVVMAGPKQVFL